MAEMRWGGCKRCQKPIPKGMRLCISCARFEADARQKAADRGRRTKGNEAGTQVKPGNKQAKPGDDQRKRRKRGRKCLVCQRSSRYPVCDDCDRRLRTPDRQRPSCDRLYSVTSIVSGGLPSLGRLGRLS